MTERALFCALSVSGKGCPGNRQGQVITERQVGGLKKRALSFESPLFWCACYAALFRSGPSVAPRLPRTNRIPAAASNANEPKPVSHPPLPPAARWPVPSKLKTPSLLRHNGLWRFCLSLTVKVRVSVNSNFPNFSLEALGFSKFLDGFRRQFGQFGQALR